MPASSGPGSAAAIAFGLEDAERRKSICDGYHYVAWPKNAILCGHYMGPQPEA
jgi:hypothetical protein